MTRVEQYIDAQSVKTIIDYLYKFLRIGLAFVTSHKPNLASQYLVYLFARAIKGNK